jgi:signal transduction histidine kinase
MLQFARKAPVNLTPLNLNERVTDLANVMFKTFPRMIDIRLDLDPNLKNVMADQIQMDQAIINLAINARDAMLARGSLTIITRNVALRDDRRHANHGLTPGSYVTLRISDTGVGISEEHLNRIFEPFFSTKQRGSERGTGLGLSVVKGIIEQHGGTVTCESALGEGTQFSVFLPCVGE